jgi:hypothetical protein
MEPTPVTRRRLLATAAGSAGGLLLGGMLRPPTALAATSPRTTWLPVGALVARRSSANLSQQVLWTTIMRVDDKLAAPLDKYYLWHSTHDVPILRLYTAPAVTGPYTERPRCALPVSPAGWSPGHFQCPDIAWDPLGRRFIASPHSHQAAGSPRAMQNTFLMESPDGQSWRYLPGAPKPIVPVGAVDDFDGYAVTYGRFLRNYDGSLVRRHGKYVWYYRGTRRHLFRDPTDSTGRHQHETFALGAATSPDLVNWTKVKGPIADPGAGQLFGLGSAIDVAGVTHLMWTVASGALAGPQIYMKRAASRDPGRFDAGPGVLVYQDPALFHDGPSYIIDGSTHYMAYGAMSAAPDQWEARLIRSPVQSNPLSILP